jgi:hypothetical protein
MKIIELAYSDVGGAGIAALRYHELLKSMGYNARLYVAQKYTDNSDIHNFT